MYSPLPNSNTLGSAQAYSGSYNEQEPDILDISEKPQQRVFYCSSYEGMEKARAYNPDMIFRHISEADEKSQQQMALDMKKMSFRVKALKLGVDMFRTRPETAEERKTWNDVVRTLMDDEEFKGTGIAHEFFVSTLSPVEGTDWMLYDGAEALADSGVLTLYEPIGNNPEARHNEYGLLRTEIDNYGYITLLPGNYQKLNFTENSLPLTIDGGIVAQPQVKFTDALGLAGMDLYDRKTFLTKVQRILDDVVPGLDARQLKYYARFLTQEDSMAYKWSLQIEGNIGVDLKGKQEQIAKALNQDTSLGAMAAKATFAEDKTVGNYTITVADSSSGGILLNSGGRTVRTTVDTIRYMDHLQIVNYIERN
ncbi:hypothetical protein FACS18942_01190 [Planctomycetales bacterium]|nr:hypothetical protein FACS18942_01190 [Planctomycetales bacterium]